MSDSNHTITFTKASSGTAGAKSLNSFVSTTVTCSVCGTSVPVTQSDVTAYTTKHGAPGAGDVFKIGVDHGTHP